ncbi:TonB-dependent receptor plug domain-containing protein [Bacteroides cellulosilyticus]|uniref:TonB-dependent receptor plug domain-containing protein n=1 Tax=Bacteroides cellulosilyticus TaxID=246787 RepID=UPI00374E0751
MSGIVLSKDDGLPIVGASVLIQGTTHGTITDVDGKFVLDNIKPTDKKVMVSFIGMKTQVVDVKSFVKVVLVTESEMMDEVMVVAYGTAKRSAFTGSASVVNAEKLSKRQTTNVVQALAGQVAGLQMTSGSGQPGGDAPTLIIRGIGSINADNDPLIIVDGMPYEGGWNNINPSDVESVSVLKDAASNALYGARGANGVIIITTKQAKAGEAVVTASAKWGVNTRGTIDYDYIKDPGEYYEGGYVTSPAGDSSYREFLEAAKELRASCEAIKLIKAYIVYQDLEKAKETIDNARDTFTRGK